MSNPPKSPFFTYNAQRPQIPIMISRHSSRMTSNGAGPYLTADRALGDGYWEAEAQKLDTDAKAQITRLGRMRRMKAVLGNITIICATCNLKLFEHVYWLEADG